MFTARSSRSSKAGKSDLGVPKPLESLQSPVLKQLPKRRGCTGPPCPADSTALCSGWWHPRLGPARRPCGLCQPCAGEQTLPCASLPLILLGRKRGRGGTAEWESSTRRTRTGLSKVGET